MHYLSIILIALGIALVIYSLINSDKKTSSSGNSYSSSFDSRVVSADRFAPNSRGSHGANRFQPDIRSYKGEEDRKRGIPAESEGSELISKRRIDKEPGVESIESVLEKNEAGSHSLSEIKRVNITDTVEILEGDEIRTDDTGRSIEGDSIVEEKPDSKIEKVDFNKKNYAVLFEDSSNVIDYDRNENIIDPTLKEYKKIKRIGKGIVELVKEGINFYIEKKFFRFDFYRIAEIKVGSQYCAVFLKGNDAARVFVFERDNSFILEISRSYQEYIRKYNS